MERVNKEVGEMTVDQVEYAVESAIIQFTHLVNVFAQILILLCQRVLKEYNKKFLMYVRTLKGEGDGVSQGCSRAIWAL